MTYERAHAAFVAAAVGDALGWPMEDRGNRVGGTSRVKPAARLVEWRRREGGGFAPHEEVIPAGAYSDDTQLLLAVGRSRLRTHDWYRHLVQAELPMWLLYERGGGGALKRSAQAWARGNAPWADEEKSESVGRYFSAGGNGVAMRCLSHVVVRAGDVPFAEVRRHVDADGLATHGHPRALVGARFFAWALWWALGRREPLGYGELLDHVLRAEPQWSEPPSASRDWCAAQTKAAPSWEEDWLQAVEESLHYLRLARESLNQGALAIDSETLERIGFFGREKGSGTITAAAAVFMAARYTSQPQQGLLAAAFMRNTDSDTLASMTAGLLGALAGGDWLGDLPRQLQDGEYIAALAEQLIVGGRGEPETTEWSRATRTSIYRELDVATPGSVVKVPIFGRSEVTAITDYETRAESFIRSWFLRTSVGQTLAIKRYDRRRGQEPRWKPQAPTSTTSEQPANGRRAGEARQPHAGLVREVADLEVARRFYEEVVGLTHERASSAYVSFGWLALERRTESGDQLTLPDPHGVERSAEAVRVYIDASLLTERHAELAAAGLRVTPVVERNGRERFRFADPDGYAIEFCARNGGPAA